MNYDIESVAEDLLGTCQDLSAVVGDHLVEDWEFQRQLREYAIRCPQCGFWFDPENVDEDDHCDGCWG